ncbi:protein-tyrosine-phosphatase [Mycolicibacterium murale]|uniref:Protein-tyrosine-phosphatase n=1 Tax=Mycolicibacterium murale TaxID=182220 RepID=A0A7I9WVI1_9MYCO|nr:low molecular weight phosphatase family protein [Mycolicibacterium murale]MCV7185743.1 low molecular weight phosphatase family protein [Mycolicibacterium murale]GFG61390.1 protein-tyrosine-phosphatase [Mycolicibacterium murale]
MHVLFVCTGNICRSPIAERLALKYGSASKIQNFSTASAGTRAVVGAPVYATAATVLRDLGGDPSQFAARQITAKMASAADLIVTMTRSHRDKVLEVAPGQLRRTYTLSELAELSAEFAAEDLAHLSDLRPRLAGRPLPDVRDPIGLGPDVFAAVGAQIAGLLPPIVDFLRRAATATG